MVYNISENYRKLKKSDRGNLLSGIVTLTTDFSSSDAYVGSMKGAMLSIASDVTIVDLAHNVAPHDVYQAAFVLESAYGYFPAGTVHVVVVDPGVGSVRRRIAMKCGDHYFVGPDNGVFTYPIRNEKLCECVEIDVANDQARLRGVTFEGRDIFGPAAAKIASGVPLSEIGKPALNPITLSIPQPTVTDGSIEGKIVYIDHFGNCVTNITLGDVQKYGGNFSVTVGGHSVGNLRKSYSDVELYDGVALINSVDHLEIALNQGSAEKALNLKVGSRVKVLLNS